MIGGIFLELSLIIILAMIVSGIMRLLKQPLIIGYIITGILASPYFFELVRSTDTIAMFSQIGIAFLLFMVGLHLNPKVIMKFGKTSLLTGLIQVIFTSIIGFFIAAFFNFSLVESLYIAVAIAFSSTIIVMKLISDKGDLETLYGRISIGVLLVQDLIVIFMLMIISSMSNHVALTELIFSTILKGIGLLFLISLASIFILPRMTNYIAKSQEFLFLFSIGWCFALAALFQMFNFSIEIGALVAGISLSLSPYHYEIASKVKPLRDFFLILFFIFLGSQMYLGNISEIIMPALILSFFVLVGKPLIIMIIMGAFGYTKRNSFMSGISLAQISEFSLILVILGVSVGHLSQNMLPLITLVGIITMGISSYMILYSERIYPHISKYLRIFERRGKKVEHRYGDGKKDYEVILFGCDRIGFDLIKSFEKINKKFLVIEYNPEIVLNLAKRGINCIYGDANDIELLNELRFSKVRMVISTIPELETNLLLIRKIRDVNKKAIIIVVSHRIDEAIELYREGATYVLMPHFLGGKYASTLIESYGINTDKFIEEKIKHLKDLEIRKKLGHEHPKHERK